MKAVNGNWDSICILKQSLHILCPQFTIIFVLFERQMGQIFISIYLVSYIPESLFNLFIFCSSPDDRISYNA